MYRICLHGHRKKIDLDPRVKSDLESKSVKVTNSDGSGKLCLEVDYLEFFSLSCVRWRSSSTLRCSVWRTSTTAQNERFSFNGCLSSWQTLCLRPAPSRLLAVCAVSRLSAAPAACQLASLRYRVITVTYIIALGKNQCWGSVTFWRGSGSPDPYLWLMDPNPTPFFSDFKDAKKIFLYFFLETFRHAHLYF